jgi:hypothetical protein
VVQPVDRAVNDLAALDTVAMDDRAAAAALVDLRRVQARLAAVEARLVQTADTGRPWADDGYRSTANWLATSDNTSLDTARAQVRVARRLRSMPATAAALAAGDISAAHAHKLASLNGPATATAFAQAEEFLVGQARSMRWPDFVKACAYWLRLNTPDDPDPDKADHDHRHVTLHRGLRGTGLLAGELTATARATVSDELDRLETELFQTDWAAAKEIHGDATTTAHLARTPAQRRHDALEDMAIRSAIAPAGGKRPRPRVSVLVGYDAFKQVCELADGTLIAPASVARLLDDAVIERIVMDGASRVLDIGRARTFTGAARRAVEITDRHCTMGPGCDVPAQRCEIDHIWRHSDGGPTRPDNGRAGCPFHHRQRENPPPNRPHSAREPDRTDRRWSPTEAATHLDTLRQRIRDRLTHDPAWG